jgi:hypothetical protein
MPTPALSQRNSEQPGSRWSPYRLQLRSKTPAVRTPWTRRQPARAHLPRCSPRVTPRAGRREPAQRQRWDRAGRAVGLRRLLARDSRPLGRGALPHPHAPRDRRHHVARDGQRVQRRVSSPGGARPSIAAVRASPWHLDCRDRPSTLSRRMPEWHVLRREWREGVSVSHGPRCDRLRYRPTHRASSLTRLASPQEHG